MAARAAKSEQLQIRVSRAEKAQLRAAASAAGVDVSAYVLSRALPRGSEQFERLTRDLARARADRSALFAAVSDLLSGLTPSQVAGATAFDPTTILNEQDLAYLASMVELAAEQRGVAAPDWAVRAPALREPMFGTPLKSLRLELLLNAPAVFRKRNIFVDSSVGDRV